MSWLNVNINKAEAQKSIFKYSVINNVREYEADRGAAAWQMGGGAEQALKEHAAKVTFSLCSVIPVC